jgi:hypothetical protein
MRLPAACPVEPPFIPAPTVDNRGVWIAGHGLETGHKEIRCFAAGNP